MGRKSNAKDHTSVQPETKSSENDDTKDMYRKRLRSWKRTSTQPKSNQHIDDDDETTSLHRSTIFTFPINLHRNRQQNSSNTRLSQSLTTDSAFYYPTLSNTSIHTTRDLNNNNLTTFDLEDSKRKLDTISYESLPSQLSQIDESERLFNRNKGKKLDRKRSSNNDLPLSYNQNRTKRSRLLTDDSIITNTHSSPVDDQTIDINQYDRQGPISSSINDESLINNSNSMEAAVKMVQPIVDIIFNAFEDQLKTIQTKPLQSSISPQFYTPMMVPYIPITSPTRPVVLHAVNFNIELNKKNSLENQSSINEHLTENNLRPSISFNELKEKIISYVLSNNSMTDEETNGADQRKRDQLKRIVQLAAVGVSVLCGYFLL